MLSENDEIIQLARFT